MNFPKELCQVIIRNVASFEGGVIESIDKVLFKAINARVEKRLKATGGWKGHYELVTGDADETAFAPSAWPEDKDGRYRACYKLDAINGDENYHWLSCVLGVNRVKMCLQFWCHGGLGGRTKAEIGRKLIGVAATGAVKEAGMTQGEENTLNLPFVFDAETLAAEYPTVEKTLAPLDAALDALLKVNPQLDAVVKELAAKK
jgi:hypothetical protein